MDTRRQQRTHLLHLLHELQLLGVARLFGDQIHARRFKVDLPLGARDAKTKVPIVSLRDRRRLTRNATQRLLVDDLLDVPVQADLRRHCVRDDGAEVVRASIGHLDEDVVTHVTSSGSSVRCAVRSAERSCRCRASI